MKIILGADPLLSPLTGIGHYTRALALAMLQEPKVSEVKLFAYGRFFSEDILTNAKKSEDSQVVMKQTFVSRMRASLSQFPPAIWAYEKVLPKVEHSRLAPFMGSHLFHAPNYFIPAFDGPKVVTFHDLSTLLLPHYHPKARVELANRQMAIAVDSSAHIICDTHFIANEVKAFFGLPDERVSTVHLAAAAEYQPRTAEQCNEALQQFDVEFKKFFLFVSTIEPRKNLSRLLDAYDEYTKKVSKPLPLVVVGGKGWNSEQEHERLAVLQRQGLVRYRGYLEQNTVYQLYSAARALIYPSLYEGFGLPVLEAMRSGTAVVTSSNSSMQEIAADAACYVNPENQDDITDAFIIMQQDNSKVHSLQQFGLQRAAEFSWQQCASQTLAVYLNVADKHKA